MDFCVGQADGAAAVTVRMHMCHRRPCLGTLVCSMQAVHVLHAGLSVGDVGV